MINQDFIKNYFTKIDFLLLGSTVFASLLIAVIEVISFASFVPVIIGIAAGETGSMDNKLILFFIREFGSNLKDATYTFIIIFCAGVIARYSLTVYNVTIANELNKRLTVRFSSFILLSSPFIIEQKHKSTLLSILNDKINIIGGQIIFSFLSIITGLLILIFAFYGISVMLGESVLVPALIFLMVFVPLFFALKRVLEIKGEEIRVYLSRRHGFVSDLIEGLHVFQVWGCGSDLTRRLANIDTKLRQARVLNYACTILPRYFFEFLAILVLGIYILTSHQDFSKLVSEVALIGYIMARLVPYFNGLASSVLVIKGALPVFKEVQDVFVQSAVHVGTRPRGRNFQRFNGRVLIDGQSEGIHFKAYLPESGLITLIGRSGIGKTTAIEGLLGLNRRFEIRAVVHTEGDNVTELCSLESFWDDIAYIPQHVPVFEGTLLENLSFFEYKPRADAALGALAKAGLLQYANKNALDLMLGRGGVVLSGGELKKLGLARFFYGTVPRKFIIFDEPTAGLDDSNARIMSEALKEISLTSLVLCISHSKVLVDLSDEVIELNEDNC